MNVLKKSSVVLMTVLLFVSIVSCEQQEGPAEKAGKKIDAAVVRTGEKIEETNKAIEKKSEEIKKELQESTSQKTE